MTPTISAPLAINTFATVSFVALIAFTVSRVLATAPSVVIPTSVLQDPGILVQEKYTGIIAWVTAQDIKITDSQGVSRTFSIDDSTHILVNGLSVDSATYASLHVLEHVQIKTLKDNLSERAETIVVQ